MRNIFTSAALLLSCLLPLHVRGANNILDTKWIGMSETMTFTATADGATSMKWILPRGFKVVTGQGTPNLVLNSTFLSQDGLLSAVRSFDDGHADTLSYLLNVYRPVESVKDYTINEGEEISLAGAMRTKADIYYEKTGEQDGKPLYTAHRLTVVPKDDITFNVRSIYGCLARCSTSSMESFSARG